MPVSPTPARPQPGFFRLAGERPLLVSLALTCFMMLLVLVAFPPHWETNDDAIMSLIAAGRVVTDAPDEHLFLQNIVVGLALQRAYLWVPAFPWYGAYIFTATAIALLAVTQAFLVSGPPARQLPFACLFLLAVGLPALAGLHYTKTAALLSLAGMLLLLAGESWPAWAAGAFLLFAASLVRLPAMLMPGLLLGPLILARFLAAPARRRWVMASCFLLPLLAGLAMGRASLWYYERDEEWRGAFARFDVPGQVVDRRRLAITEQTLPLIAQAGLEPIDVALVWNWNFLGLDAPTEEKMRSLLASAGLDARVPNRHAILQADLMTMQAVACLAGLLAGLLAGGRRDWIMPALCAATTVAALLTLAEFFKVEFYLTHSMLAVAFAAALLGPGREPVPQGGAARKIAAAVAFLVALACALGNAGVRHGMASRHVTLQEGTAGMLARLRPRADQLHIVWWHHMLYAHIAPPLRSVTAPESFKAAGANMLALTPFTRRRLDEFGVSGDPLLALCRRKDLFLFNDDDRNRVLAQYLHERHRVRLGAKVVISDPSMGASRLYSLIDVTAAPNKKGGTRP